ncbi:Lhr-like helicases [Desulfocucumis palustris]|uniref:Lhr-like helicases n=1 Tax=Desulfocucumis palustris TaxID=1898651 RepID=A0A2L2X7G0_9FIRM|nr:protein DpdJ [Desulfocucumis palustris]GBF31834.1 Lhr-like helicases [Desulfocucumis palustris]
MQRSRLDYLAEEVLSQLERQETDLLSWGFLGGKFDVRAYVRGVLQSPATPLLAQLWEEQQQQGVAEQDIIANLKERKLLIVDREGQGRSRYAETVRLLYLLKQRFNEKDWQSAPNLVSNIKMQLRYRHYPRRDQDWSEVEDKLRQKGNHSEFGFQVMATLLGVGSIQLAGFQMQSLFHLLEAVKGQRDTATIIGAGTGSGKTKAFYLPAFAQICNCVKDDPRPWVRVLAIYPRVELLKDQLKESLAEADKLNNFLLSKGLRPISVGTYFGDTPGSAREVEESKYYQWERGQEGYICPYLTCPHCTNGQLVWRFIDHASEVAKNEEGIYGQYEKLHCASCGEVISSKNIVLTRKRMEQFPPDILFTTTEMLNRKLCSIGDQHVFGLGDARPPQFVLLDEVHIYNGATGAHVAYVLRRWRNLVRHHSPNNAVHFVGLSATLTNPQFFFASLTGVTESATTYITPDDGDLISEGMEYNLVLRGDPISAAALLSTSVQTAMLMGRVLDPLRNDVSRGAWGTKIFGFTDKMDVINRWYHIQKDAEENLLLARFRDPKKITDQSLMSKQRKLGQVWQLAREIDAKCLLNPLRIGITSSQFRGVDSSAKLVIATSTLEVGFNDPDVGAVIQHKAPRDMASFLQRKGRGGRTRGMRPWTLVITSAYGRDRWVYDNPQQIFDPVLPELNLPLRNSYIQQIQAAFVLMDWLGWCLAIQGHCNANMRYILSPRSKGKCQIEKKILCEVLARVLEGDYQQLATFVESSLKLDQADLHRVMWLPSRSLMFGVIPALLQQLKSDWDQFVVDSQVVAEGTALDEAPLAGYVPKNLFSNIEVRELELIIPGRGERESLALRQGMFEFAPGNVSKRYINTQKLNDAHWFPVPLDSDVVDLGGGAVRGVPVAEIDRNGSPVTVVTPIQYKLEAIPKQISDRSTGFLQWETLIQPGGHDGAEHDMGRVLQLKQGSSLDKFIKGIRAFTTGENQPVLITRYAPEVSVELKFKKGSAQRKTLYLTHRSQRAALGFQSYVDAIAMDYSIPDMRELLNCSEWPLILTQLRPEFYLQTLKEDPNLRNILSVFEIEWLCQVCLSSIVAISISRGITLADALQDYHDNPQAISERTIQAIFQVSEVSPQDQQGQEDARLLRRLKEYIKTPAIYGHFLDRASCLYKDIIALDSFWQWLSERYASTLAAALQAAVAELLPDTNTDDLILDIQNNTIWLSEPDAGGMGVVNSIASAIENNPGKFEEAMLYASSSCRRHELSRVLDVILASLQQSSIQGVFQNIRGAMTLEKQREGLKQLQRNLYGLGLAPSRELVVAVTYKLLSQNSCSSTDELAMMLHKTWHNEEKRLACRIDPRVFAVAGLRVDDIKDRVDDVLRQVEPVADIDERQRFTLVESLLWSGCLQSCPDCLQLYSPYGGFAEPSRIVLTSLLEPGFQLVDYATPQWLERVKEFLIQGIRVRVKAHHSQKEDCRREILNLIQVPLDMGFELLYPFVDGIHNSGADWLFDVNIREVLHV